MPDLDLATVTADTFRPFIGQTFEAVFTDGRLPLTLSGIEAGGSARPDAPRPPFSLIFQGAGGLRLPQHIYRLENAALGAAEIFLVQIAVDAKASKFEAAFA